MRLRTQLVIAFTGLLLVVIAVVGTIVVQSSRVVLTNQVDEMLTGIQNRTPPDRRLRMRPRIAAMTRRSKA